MQIGIEAGHFMLTALVRSTDGRSIDEYTAPWPEALPLPVIGEELVFARVAEPERQGHTQMLRCTVSKVKKFMVVPPEHEDGQPPKPWSYQVAIELLHETKPEGRAARDELSDRVVPLFRGK